MGSHPFPLDAMQLTSPLPSPSAIPEHSTLMGDHQGRAPAAGSSDMLVSHRLYPLSLPPCADTSSSGHAQKHDPTMAPCLDHPSTSHDGGALPTPGGGNSTSTSRRRSIERVPLVFNAPNGDAAVYPLSNTPTPPWLQRVPFVSQGAQGILEEVVLADSTVVAHVATQPRAAHRSRRKRHISWFSSEEGWDKDARSSKRTETLPCDSVATAAAAAAAAAAMDVIGPQEDGGDDMDGLHTCLAPAAAPIVEMTTSVSGSSGTAAAEATTTSMEALGVMDSPNSALPSPSLSPVSATAADDDTDELWPPPAVVASRSPQDTTSDTTGAAAGAAGGGRMPLEHRRISSSGASHDDLAAGPRILDTYTHLPSDGVRQYLLLHLLRRSEMATLRLAHDAITQVLRKDGLRQLPKDLQRRVLLHLDARALCRAAQVSRRWNRMVDGDAELWRLKMEEARFTVTGDERRQYLDPRMDEARAYKAIFRNHFVMRLNWRHNRAARLQLAGHSRNVVTCLQFDEDKIITASDDQTVNIYDIRTGRLRNTLRGHDGGVWALQYVGNTLVTGATDRTLRVWDIDTGECRHVLTGHTGTVRCLTIVMPIHDPATGRCEPEHPMIVSGSRDNTLRVWRLPQPTASAIHDDHHPRQQPLPQQRRQHPHHQQPYPNPSASTAWVPDSDSSNNDTPLAHGKDPRYARAALGFSVEMFAHPDWHTRSSRHGSTADDNDMPEPIVLHGHRLAVRALAAHGNLLASGSYDGTVRLWHLKREQQLRVLVGHTAKVYSVVIDAARNRCISGSMDSNVRIWNLSSGACERVLRGHTILVGLLGLSASHLVSAAADQTLRVWSAESGECQNVLVGHEGAITSFQHDEHKVVSGSEGGIKMWDIKTGELLHDLVTNVTNVWRVAFDERRLIVAVKGADDVTRLEVFDYAAKIND